MLDNSHRKQRTRAQDARHKFSSLEMLHRIITNLPEPRDVFRQTLSQCVSSNPVSARWIVALMALYLHLGPFSRVVIRQIEDIIEAVEGVPLPPPAIATQAGAPLSA